MRRQGLKGGPVLSQVSRTSRLATVIAIVVAGAVVFAGPAVAGEKACAQEVKVEKFKNVEMYPKAKTTCQKQMDKSGCQQMHMQGCAHEQKPCCKEMMKSPCMCHKPCGMDKMHRCKMHGCCECFKYMCKQIPWQREKAVQYKREVCQHCKMMYHQGMHEWQTPMHKPCMHSWQRPCDESCKKMHDLHAKSPCMSEMKMAPEKKMIWKPDKPEGKMTCDKIMWHEGEPGAKVQKRIIIEQDDGSENMMECIGDITELLGSTEGMDIEVEEMGGMKIITITSEGDEGEEETLIIKMKMIED
jgi:hypothetical protein